MTVRVVSYGGGVQSTALLVLAAQGEIDFPTFLFANVGDDSEHPATLRYVRDVAMSYAATHGIELVELHKIRRDGSRETLFGRLTKPGSRSISIPVRMSDTGAPGTRSCTVDFKIQVIGKALRRRGASPDNPATVGIGFSTDELHRASPKRKQPWEVPVYPLLDLGLSRAACQTLIANAGLPVPPKSACYFCPFHRPATWAEMRRDEPDLFDKSVALERLLNDRLAARSCPTFGVPAVDPHDVEMAEAVGDPAFMETTHTHERRGACPDCGRVRQIGPGDLVLPHPLDPVYLTRFGRPLDEAIAEAQASLFDPDGPEMCDEGACWT